MKKVLVVTLAVIGMLFCGSAYADLDDGLVAYYPFNGNADDESGNGNDGIENGNITYVVGKTEKSIKFGGIDDKGYLKISNSESLKFSENVSVSFWIKHNDSWGQTGANCSGKKIDHASQVVLAKSGDRYGMRVTSSVNKNFNSHVGISANAYDSTKKSEIGYGSNIAMGEWLYVTTITGNNGSKIYINGEVVASDDRVTDFSVTNSENMYIGIQLGKGSCLDWWYPLNGELDEFRIYNRALTDSEIQELYELNEPPDEEPDDNYDLCTSFNLFGGLTSPYFNVTGFGINQFYSVDFLFASAEPTIIEISNIKKVDELVDTNSSYAASFNLENNILSMPCIDLGFVGKYEATFNYTSHYPIQFTLTSLDKMEDVQTVQFPVEEDGWKLVTYNENSRGTGHQSGVTWAGYDFTVDDTFAIDLNLNTPAYNADQGKEVRPVQSGTVIVSKGSLGGVIIEHTEPLTLDDGTVLNTWYSEYVHMDISDGIVEGTEVTQDTVIGKIGDQGATNDHLHFAVCSGTSDQLISIDIMHQIPSFTAPIGSWAQYCFTDYEVSMDELWWDYEEEPCHPNPNL